MGCLLLLLLFVAFPVAEFTVTMKVAAHIGLWDTVILLVFSAFWGTYLAKHQGMVVMSRIQACLAQGRVPTQEMLDGFLVFLGGVLFVFPGFISDIMGLVLVFPPTRWVVRYFVVAGFRGHVTPSSGEGAPVRPASRRTTEGIGRGPVEDAEVVE